MTTISDACLWNNADGMHKRAPISLPRKIQIQLYCIASKSILLSTARVDVLRASKCRLLTRDELFSFHVFVGGLLPFLVGWSCGC